MRRREPILMAGSLPLAVFVAVTMVATPAIADSAPSYTEVTGGSVTLAVPHHNEILSFNVTTAGTIPKQVDQFITSNKVVGYAWLGKSSTGGDIPFVAATIHTGILDTIQKPNGWHLHSGTLTLDDACSAYSGLAIATLTDPTGAGINIKGSSLSARISEDKVVVSESSFSGNIAAFTLVPVTTSSGTVTCVDVLSMVHV